MRIGIIGAGRIGANAARLFAAAGHDVMLSFARSDDALRERAEQIGSRARTGSVAEAARFGEVVMLSVPWPQIDRVLEAAGDALVDTIVIDTTNPFGPEGLVTLPEGLTPTQHNQERMPSGVRLVKAFNTLTAGFQAEASTRSGPDRVAMFLAGDDDAAKDVVSALIAESGFVPIDVGAAAQSQVMEAPRRPGALYGEEYREPESRAAVTAWQAGEALPATPVYGP